MTIKIHQEYDIDKDHTDYNYKYEEDSQTRSKTTEQITKADTRQKSENDRFIIHTFASRLSSAALSVSYSDVTSEKKEDNNK